MMMTVSHCASCKATPSITNLHAGMTLGFNESVLVVEESSGDTTICLTKSRISAVALTVNIAVNGLSATPNDGNSS